jgi:hypothetical protein
MWATIHSVALGYPHQPTDSDKFDYQKFFNSLGNVIPCCACKTHYLNLLQKHPIQLQNKLDLFKWTVTIHNEVNLIRSDVSVWSVDEALKQWSRTEYIFIDSASLAI